MILIAPKERRNSSRQWVGIGLILAERRLENGRPIGRLFYCLDDSITIPIHESIKRIYILLVKEAIERIDENEAGKDD